MPPIAVLGGLLINTSYIISPATVQVPGTEWCEKALVWLSINMPTGSTKSALYLYLHTVIIKVRERWTRIQFYHRPTVADISSTP